MNKNKKNFPGCVITGSFILIFLTFLSFIKGCEATLTNNNSFLENVGIAFTSQFQAVFYLGIIALVILGIIYLNND